MSLIRFCVLMISRPSISISVFLNVTAHTSIYTLSLHDALPIWRRTRPARLTTAPSRPRCRRAHPPAERPPSRRRARPPLALDRKSTRLNSSHMSISYAVFCLKKKTFVVVVDSDRELLLRALLAD